MGIEFGNNPVQIHLDGLNGQVVATAVPYSNSGNFTQAVTLPASVTPGRHVLVATEAAATPDGKNDGSSTGTPARTVIDVGGPGGATSPSPAASGLPTVNIPSGSGTSVGTLALIGLAAAGGSLFLAGGLALATSRRRRHEPETVKAP